MVLTGYYNQENKTVVIIKKNVENPTIKTKGDITILSNDNEVVGLNIKVNQDHSSHIVDLSEYQAVINEYFGVTKIENPFIYGEIISCEKHPKSEKLQICQINVNQEEPIQIVCGASNCVAGKIAIVAMVGAVMPTGLQITSSKLIDVPSEGMLCSEYELGLVSEMKKGIKLFELGEKTIGEMIK